MVGGLATVMMAFDPRAGDVDDRRPVLTALMEEVSGQPDAEDGGAVVLEIPCTFEGPDLAEVASLVRSTPEAVVDMMTAAPLTVAVVGFSPGFAYLAGLPAPLRRVPRRSRPRPTVPAGSVALAGGHAAVYPSASPGGWQLVGHTDELLFTPWVPPYARLAPGDRVRFVRSSEQGARRSIPTDDPVADRAGPPPGARPGLRGGRAGPAVRPAGRREEREWPPSVSRPRPRPTPTRFDWPTNWSGTRSARAPSRSRRAARTCGA